MLKERVGAQVIATLVNLVMQLPCFDTDVSIDHAEFFAGCMSVTKAELEAMGFKTFVLAVSDDG